MVRKRIAKKVRQTVYAKYNGHCAYCGKEMNYKDMQVDHIKSVYRAEINGETADNTLDNYMPSCRACNFYKSTSTIEEFRKKVSTLHDRLEKQFIYRLAKSYGMVVEKPMTKFYFETVK